MEEPDARGSWKACNNLDPMAKVLIKEEAIDIARDYFKKLSTKITEACQDPLINDNAKEVYLADFKQLISEEGKSMLTLSFGWPLD